MNINVFLLFLSFVFLQIERERERERERGYIKLGIRRNGLKVYLSFFLWWSSCGEYFLFYGLIDFMLFLILAWRTWFLRVRDIFCLLLPGVLALVPSATNPVQQLTFLIIYFRWREGVPTSVLGSQPIICLLSSSPWPGDPLGLLYVTPYPILHSSGRQVQTSVLNGHSLMACYC